MDYRTYSALRLPFDPDPSHIYHSEEQAILWRTLIEFSDGITRNYFGENAFQELLEVLNTMSELSKGETVRTGLLSLDDTASMMNVFPKLSPEGFNSFVSAANEIVGKSVVMEQTFTFAVTASLLYETRLSGRKFPRIAESQYRIAVDADIASYSVWHTTAAIKDEATLLIETSVREFKEQSSNLIIEEQNRQVSTNGAYVELQERHTALRSAIAEAHVQLKSAIAGATQQVNATMEAYKQRYGAAAGQLKQIEQTASELSNSLSSNHDNLKQFKTAAYEALKIDSTRKLWDSRAKSSLVAFIISASLIAVLLIGVPTVGLFNVDIVIRALERVGEATVKGLPASLDGAQLTLVTISRLIVISLPIALYFWVVKLLVRFNMRSLMLMDDANQRHTMIDTYFRLIEQDGATKADRALVLNALFRPLPGGGQESVEPPNFTELLEKATGKG